jgi:hypothetical protein
MRTPKVRSIGMEILTGRRSTRAAARSTKMVGSAVAGVANKKGRTRMVVVATSTQLRKMMLERQQHVDGFISSWSSSRG